jgi:hypothetical protein
MRVLTISYANGVTTTYTYSPQYHTWRHIDNAGIDRSTIQNMIESDLEKQQAQPGLNIRNFTVRGQQWQYNAFKFNDGTINVGRISPLR